MRLTKQERSFIAEGWPYAPPNRIVTTYEFIGMPPGQKAFAANANAEGCGEDRWQRLRVIDGVQGNWQGDFRSMDSLHPALEIELNAALVS